MSRLEELPPDQRAALSILLRQHKSYAEVAAMLGISERSVHDRAHAALAVLAPSEARGLDPGTRKEIGDYMLGQQPGWAERLRTRTLLSSSPAASLWARALAGQLNGAGELPEIPPAPAGSPAPRAADAPAHGSLAEQAASPRLWEPPAAPSSRLGGALLLAAIVAVVVVVLVLLLNGGSSKNGAGTTAATTTAGSATGPKLVAHFTLKAPAGSGSKGTVEILSQSGKSAYYIQAEHIPASKSKHFFYAVWLYDSPSKALALSKSPPVGKSHKLAGAALLPEEASEYHEILLTRETQAKPTHPGRVVLRGPFSLKG